MRAHEGADRWINLKFINEFPKMRKFKLSLADVYEMMTKSIIVDVDRQ